jgi:hypothetical protein
LALSRSAKNWWRSATASCETRSRWKTARSAGQSLVDRHVCGGRDGVDDGLHRRPALARLQRIGHRHGAIAQALRATSAGDDAQRHLRQADHGAR